MPDPQDPPVSGSASSGPSASEQRSAGQRPWEERLADAGARMEEELRRVVRFLDEEVVPEVRRNSSRALRVAAEQLQQLAERMEDRKAPPAPPPPPAGPSQT